MTGHWQRRSRWCRN